MVGGAVGIVCRVWAVIGERYRSIVARRGCARVQSIGGGVQIGGNASLTNCSIVGNNASTVRALALATAPPGGPPASTAALPHTQRSHSVTCSTVGDASSEASGLMGGCCGSCGWALVRRGWGCGMRSVRAVGRV